MGRGGLFEKMNKSQSQSVDPRKLSIDAEEYQEIIDALNFYYSFMNNWKRGYETKNIIDQFFYWYKKRKVSFRKNLFKKMVKAVKEPYFYFDFEKLTFMYPYIKK